MSGCAQTVNQTPGVSAWLLSRWLLFSPYALPQPNMLVCRHVRRTAGQGSSQGAKYSSSAMISASWVWAQLVNQICSVCCSRLFTNVSVCPRRSWGCQPELKAQAVQRSYKPQHMVLATFVMDVLGLSTTSSTGFQLQTPVLMVCRMCLGCPEYSLYNEPNRKCKLFSSSSVSSLPQVPGSPGSIWQGSTAECVWAARKMDLQAKTQMQALQLFQ